MGESGLISLSRADQGIVTDIPPSAAAAGQPSPDWKATLSPSLVGVQDAKLPASGAVLAAFTLYPFESRSLRLSVERAAAPSPTIDSPGAPSADNRPPHIYDAPAAR